MVENLNFWLGVWFGIRIAKEVEHNQDILAKLEKLEKEALNRLEAELSRKTAYP